MKPHRPCDEAIIEGELVLELRAEQRDALAEILADILLEELEREDREVPADTPGEPLQ